jgi:hypothetical protein
MRRRDLGMIVAVPVVAGLAAWVALGCGWPAVAAWPRAGGQGVAGDRD